MSKMQVNVGGQMLQVRTVRSMGLGDGWGRQTQAKDSSYESQKHGIWEDKVTRSDRDPMRQLSAQLRRAGTTMAGMRLDQHDPHIIARNFLAGEARRDKQFGMLWNSMSPKQCNQLVEAGGANIRHHRRGSPNYQIWQRHRLLRFDLQQLSVSSTL